MIDNDDEVIVLTENVTIFEGETRKRAVNIRKRSDKLIKFAIRRYTENGIIACRAFEFDKFYKDIDKSYIEMHHIRPICQYKNVQQEQFLEEALKNIVSLCANCHQVVHLHNPCLDVKKVENAIQFSFQKSAI